MVNIKQLEIKLQTAKTAKERFEINQAINFIKKQRETAKKEREEAKLWENGENGSWLDKEQYKSFHGC